MARKREEHEHVVDLVEDQMVLGFERPNQIIKLVNEALGKEHLTHLRIGDKRTAQKMIDDVYGRWKRSNGDTEVQRKRLLAEAEEGTRRSYALLAKALRESNVNAAVGALRNVEKFQQRRARLLGLDKIAIDIGMTPEAIDELRDQRLAEAVAGAARDPIRDLYGAAEDPGQGDGGDHPVQPSPGAAQAREGES
jgi:hypothetical protein